MDIEDVCPICGSETFENQDGHYYCLECGTQSQALRDEVEEEPTEAGSLSQQLKAKKGRKRKLDEEEDSKECDLNLHKCWQIIYQSYIDSLIQHGFDPSLAECAKAIWFIYLKYLFKYQLEHFNRLDTMELPCNKTTRNGLTNADMMQLWVKNWKSYREKLEGSSQSADNELDEIKKIRETVFNDLALIRRNAYVNKKTIFILIYLSLLYSGQFITFADYLNLTFAGVVPYYNWHQLIPQVVAQKLLFHHKRRNPDTPIPVREISRRLYHYKIMLGLQILPIDLTHVGSVLLKKMLLPGSLNTPLRRLLHIFQSGLLSTVSFRFLYIGVNVMVLIVMLLKLIYRLDDHYELLQSEHCVTEISPDADANSCFVYVWEDWVAMVTNKHYSDLQTSLCPRKRDLCKLDDPSEYLTYCKEKCFKIYTAGKGTLRSREYNVSPLFTEYMSSRRARGKSSNTDKRRPLFMLVGDKVKVVSSGEIIPRWIPMDLSLPSLGKASRCYVPLQLGNPETVNFSKLRLPSSQQFLFKFASEIMSIPLNDFLCKLSAVEKFICTEVERATDIMNVYKNCMETDADGNCIKK